MKSITLLLAFVLMSAIYSVAQTPKLEVQGDGNEIARIHSTPNNGTSSGIELLLGSGGIGNADWRVVNVGGRLEFNTSYNNFSISSLKRMTINHYGYLGLGTDDPETTLHIATGAEASNSGDGYLLIGEKAGFNIVMDNNEINSRNNGVQSGLHLQREGGHLYMGANGGNTYANHGGGHLYSGGNGGNSYLSHGGGNTFTGFYGGNTYLSYGGGDVGINTGTLHAKLNIESSDYQIYVRNEEGGVNDWFIGASHDGWAVGDDLLVFSPTSASADAAFRLRDVADNDGNVAPVEIVDGSQKILMDGNEIDANSPLYINHNSDENTYINPTGGQVAIGSSSPWGRLHVEIDNNSDEALTLESNHGEWSITPSTTHTNSNLFFKPVSEQFAISGISSVDGAYLTFSDKRMKENIQGLQDVMEKVESMNFYSYSLKNSESNKQTIGLIAQELKEVFPEFVDHGDNDFLAVKYGQLSVVALKAIQELNDENRELKRMLKDQSDRLTEIENLLKHAHGTTDK